MVLAMACAPAVLFILVCIWLAVVPLLDVTTVLYDLSTLSSRWEVWVVLITNTSSVVVHHAAGARHCQGEGGTAGPTACCERQCCYGLQVEQYVLLVAAGELTTAGELLQDLMIMNSYATFHDL